MRKLFSLLFTILLLYCLISEKAVSQSTNKCLLSQGVITGPQSVPSGSSAIYTTTPVENATTLLWTVPVGWVITSGQGTLAITVTAGATFGNIFFYGYNECGVTVAFRALMVIANNSPVPVSVTITSNPVGTTCSGTPVTFTAVPVNGGPSPFFQWMVNGGNVGGNSNTYSYTPVNNDMVVCKLTSDLPNVFNNPATSNALTMSVNPLPVPTITGAASACAGTTGVTYSTEAGMTGYTWTVSAGGSITAGSGTNTITVTWSTAGSQTVSVNYTNTNGCTATSATITNVTVNPLPVPTITGAASACAGTTGVTYSTEAGMTGYTWTVSAGGSITAGSGTNTITVTWSTSGAQTVSVNYTNANSCTAVSATVLNITVNALPASPTSGTQVPSQTQIIWNWNTVSGVTGYKWNTTNNYATATDMGTSTSTTETGLTCNTAYTRYVWAYNTCTSLPATLTQTTSDCCGLPITDARDNKVYNTVMIGTQCWMAQNLNIGIKIIGSNYQADNGIIEKYCYDNLETNCNIYGGLYQWNEMMQYVTTAGVQGICPTGWHLPTDGEWTILTTYLGGQVNAGGKMKSTGTIEAGTGLWHDPNYGATNISGFSAVPGGILFYSNTFAYVGDDGAWWSSSVIDSSNAWWWFMSYNTVIVSRGNNLKINGFSVRCVRNF